jgi:hypothetical protein
MNGVTISHSVALDFAHPISGSVAGCTIRFINQIRFLKWNLLPGSS